LLVCVWPGWRPLSGLGGPWWGIYSAASTTLKFAVTWSCSIRGGGVIGPVIAGAIFDRWKTYEPLLWSLVVVFIVAGLFFASLNRAWQKATGQLTVAC